MDEQREREEIRPIKEMAEKTSKAMAESGWAMKLPFILRGR